MSKLKVVVLMGTRPEIIKLSEVIKKCDQYFDLVMVHTGQNYDYELNEIFFKDLGLRKPDYYLGVVGNNLGQTMGNVIEKTYNMLVETKPDAFLVLGDTNSALGAIAAKRLKVPIFHMEAGNRCFDENLPEEINRKIVDHISDINMPYTEHARRYLLNEGLKPEQTFVTGSPMKEVLNLYGKQIENSDVLKRLGLEKNKYFLVSAHREENIDNEETFFELMNSINKIAETYGLPVIYSTHPRTAKFIEKRNFKFHPLVKNLKPFGFFDYCNLQLNSYCVLSDSGTLAEESAILKFPAVSLRTSTERPEVLDKGAFVLGGVKEKDVLQAVELSKKMSDNNEIMYPALDYVDDNTSVKVVKLIQSYTKIVNMNTWRKYD